MKKFGLFVILLLAGAWPALAQVSVEILMEQDQYLPAESIPIAVRIVNRSGQSLRLGADSSWLKLSVESRDGTGAPVERLGDVPVVGEFELENAKMATKRLDLAPSFLLTRSGRYGVVATVHIPGWDRELVSAPKLFMIIDGSRLWERDFGVPNSSTSAGEPETRKYILQQANYLRGQIRLYLRLTDATGQRTIRVFPIGSMISFGRPEPQVDKFSNLHVLYQNGAHSFSYVVFNPDGDTVIRQTHDYANNRPRLRVTTDGEVVITGGSRRISPTDLPPPPPETVPDETASPAAAPEPALTNSVPKAPEKQ